MPALPFLIKAKPENHSPATLPLRGIPRLLLLLLLLLLLQVFKRRETMTKVRWRDLGGGR